MHETKSTSFNLPPTKNIADPKEKVKKVYEYVQQKTRYIIVQVGIGGYQPILASDVDRTAYGDCKGLVNYTQALLQSIGVNSWYVVVASGNVKKSALPDFASMNQFDHVILCIPFKNDTTWVNCTSKENPFGYLGTFTDDRLALACTESDGKLIRTPKLKNLQVRKAEFNLNEEGVLTGQMQTRFEGSQYDNRDMLVHESKSEQIKTLVNIYRIENTAIQSFQLKQEKTTLPYTEENLQLNIRNFASITKDACYLPLNQVNLSWAPKEVGNRQNEVYVNRGYMDTDEISFNFPKTLKSTFCLKTSSSKNLLAISA